MIEISLECMTFPFQGFEMGSVLPFFQEGTPNVAKHFIFALFNKICLVALFIYVTHLFLGCNFYLNTV